MRHLETLQAEVKVLFIRFLYFSLNSSVTIFLENIIFCMSEEESVRVILI